MAEPDITTAVATARAATTSWAQTPAHQRATMIGALAGITARAADEIVDTVTAETGRVPADVVMAEVLHAVNHARWLARHAPRVLATERHLPTWPVITTSATVTHRPLGVAGVIAPGNYPFLLPFLPAVTAIAAGCTLVVKPAPETPRSATLLATLALRAGFPDDVLTVVPGGAETGAQLARADVDVLSVTGSTETGRAVARLAAERLVPVIAELGGKDPLLVLTGADVSRAARATVWGACFNAGQSCVSIERVYVVDDCYEPYVAALLRAFDDVTVATCDARDIGPLVSHRQADRVRTHLDDAVARGARIVRGGGVREIAGRVYAEPTLLVDVDPEAVVLREETFGPIIPVVRVADEDAAVAAANDSDYALAASVFAYDAAAGRRTAARLRAGAVAVNDVAVPYAIPGLPFGGRGASGLGRQGGAAGLLAYTAPLAVTTPRFPTPRELQWFPRVLGERGWRRVALVRAGAIRKPKRKGDPWTSFR